MTQTKSTATPAPAAGTAPRVPLSLNQQFLRSFDKGPEDGAFGHRHTLVGGWRLRGPVDTARLRAGLDAVVHRHEALRTEIVADDDGGHQVVRPAGPVTLTEVHLPADGDRDTAAEEYLNTVDASVFPVAERPHLRAHLGRFSPEDAVLVLATHHTSTDAWSLQVIARDLLAAYGDPDAAPAEPPVPYREFALAQQSGSGSDPVRRARAYWQSRLGGAPITGLATDRPHEERTPADYGVERFVLGRDLSTGTTARARAVRGTPFMVLAAAYTVLLRERTGAGDVVFPTFSAGRWEERYAHAVGPFFNFLPIRVDTRDCATYGDVLTRTRTACLGAYQHEIPFAHVAEDSPGLLAPFADPGLAVAAFEMLQAPFGADGPAAEGGPSVAEIRRRTLSQRVSSAIPNGALWALDLLADGELVGSLKFDHSRWDRETVVGLLAGFTRHLEITARAPETELPH